MTEDKQVLAYRLKARLSDLEDEFRQERKRLEEKESALKDNHNRLLNNLYEVVAATKHWLQQQNLADQDILRELERQTQQEQSELDYWYQQASREKEDTRRQIEDQFAQRKFELNRELEELGND